VTQDGQAGRLFLNLKSMGATTDVVATNHFEMPDFRGRKRTPSTSFLNVEPMPPLMEA
jgi:hypothetical protein